MEVSYGELLDVMRKMKKENHVILAWTGGMWGMDFSDQDAEQYNEVLLKNINELIRLKMESARGKKQRRVV